MSLDVPGTFSAPLNFTDVQAVGAIVSADRSINFTRLHARTAQGAIDGAGRYYWGEAGPDGALHPGLALDASIAGALSVRDVVAMWPMTLASGTHGYLDRTLRSGAVTDARAHIDIRPADSAGGPMRNDAINVTFNVSGGEMQFLETMSPVTGARASAVLGANSFHMLIPEGRLNNLALSNGRIDVAQFSPHEGQFVTIQAHAEGDARNIMEVLMQRPLDLRQRIPVDAASVTGRGSVNLTLQRPMEHDVPFSDWRFSVDGRLQNFAGVMAGRRVPLANGQLSVRGDQRAIVVSGPIRAGGSNVQIAWTERLNQPPGRSSSNYQISGDFDARDLVRLGYSVAQYAEGRVGVTISGQGRGFDIDQARLDLNLNNAAIDSPWHFWTKPAGQAASLRVNLGRSADGGLVLDDIDGRGSGATIQGVVRLRRDGQIMDVNLPRLVLQGRSNARVTAARGSNGGLNFEVRGSLFDAAPFMNGDANMDGSSAQPAAGQTPVAPARPEPVRASVVVDNLKMRGGVDARQRPRRSGGLAWGAGDADRERPIAGRQDVHAGAWAAQRRPAGAHRIPLRRCGFCGGGADRHAQRGRRHGHRRWRLAPRPADDGAHQCAAAQFSGRAHAGAGAAALLRRLAHRTGRNVERRRHRLLQSRRAAQLRQQSREPSPMREWRDRQWG